MVAIAGKTRRDDTSTSGSGKQPGDAVRDVELERRRRELEAGLAARRVDDETRGDRRKPDSSGFGQALKLSSEFIAGVVVGGGLGWLIDRWLGISPWGLIVFLLLGFGAGVLNVLRSAGMVADAGMRTKSKDDGSEVN